MKYTVRNKHTNTDIITFGVNYSKNEKFKFKPEWVSHLSNLHSLKYEDSGYTSTAYFVPTTIQMFWLKFIFYIEVHKIELSDGNRYINFESSHEYVVKKKREQEQDFLNRPSNFFNEVD